MKKIILIVIVLLLVVGFTSFAADTAIGVAWIGDFNFVNWGGLGNDIALSFKLPKFPPVFDLTLWAGSGYFKIGLIGDWWLVNKELAENIFFWYLGPGFVASIAVGGVASIGLAARLPIGLQIFPIEPLELFLEVAPAIGVGISTGGGGAGLTGGIMTGIGARYWF